MPKFNFLDTPEANRETNIGRVRTRARAIDRFEGLKGRDYLEASRAEPLLRRDDDVPPTPAWMLR